ncbi:EamA-like transporter family protein [Geodermatophilus saharensis]|uniref:EamA-like transporter family protein n=1 Tax=Geodermatophilus saharensis TaxID=1137994 RepID=A0A239ID64_9ACTN|nr:SMR family transporter [Geodermatophilus saharensis]SNS91178.1 EamA-like transporter family protein [Geodermatophilus saharensis]
MTPASFGLVLIGVLLNAGAQLLIKAGTNALGTLVSPDGPVQTVFRIVFQPYILGGLLSYVVSVAVWIVVLSRVPVSVAYPMLSIGYVVNAVLGYLLFREELGVLKIVGILVIILGVILVARPTSAAVVQ